MPRRKSKGGRPTKLDDATWEAICKDVAAGVPQEAAAICAGIDGSTLRLWKRQGREKPDSLYGRFSRALAQASEQAHQRLAKATYIHAMQDGKLGLQVLGRRWSKHWAETQTVELAGKKGRPIETVTRDETSARLREKLKRLEQTGAGE